MTEPRIPNLFILGAAECGTTARSHYLAGHPDIFMSEQAGVKEPRYFSSDTWRPGVPHITDWEQYLRLFSSAPASVRYLGEASVCYISSKRAAPTILEYCPKPVFVVMLRDPVELAASQHNQKVKEGVEDKDFESAGRLQEERKQGRSLPPGVSVPLQYGKVGKLGAKLKRLFEWVDREHVHCIFYDDFKKDPASSYAGLLDFLNLPHDGRTDFSRVNPSVTYRWPALENNLHRIKRFREQLRIPGGIGVHALIDRYNQRPGREPLRPEFERE